LSTAVASSAHSQLLNLVVSMRLVAEQMRG
jgi:hypothetical protein